MNMIVYEQKYKARWLNKKKHEAIFFNAGFFLLFTF